MKPDWIRCNGFDGAYVVVSARDVVAVTVSPERNAAGILPHVRIEMRGGQSLWVEPTEDNIKLLGEVCRLIA